MPEYGKINKDAKQLVKICEKNNQIKPELFAEYNIKRGLRDKDGNGVLAGITNISRIDAFKTVDGKKVPCDGQLWYRGYNVYDLIRGLSPRHRFGFEEVAYLLLFGELPSESKLKDFGEVLARCRCLPTNFTRDVITQRRTGTRIFLSASTTSVRIPLTLGMGEFFPT